MAVWGIGSASPQTSATIPLTIGAWIGDGASYSTSRIDDVAVWDHVLSAPQVAALAAQKRHLALYLTTVAFVRGGQEAFKTKYLATGKKLDMGRSCLRFKNATDLATDIIAESISSMPVDEFLQQYEQSRSVS